MSWAKFLNSRLPRPLYITGMDVEVLGTRFLLLKDAYCGNLCDFDHNPPLRAVPADIGATPEVGKGNALLYSNLKTTGLVQFGNSAISPLLADSNKLYSR